MTDGGLKIAATKVAGLRLCCPVEFTLQIVSHLVRLRARANVVCFSAQICMAGAEVYAAPLFAHATSATLCSARVSPIYVEVRSFQRACGCVV